MVGFYAGLRPAIDFKKSLSYDREYLKNIAKKVTNAEISYSVFQEREFKDSDLECNLIYDQWWAFDERYAGVLDKDEMRVVIVAIEEALECFDGDIHAIIGSYDELQALQYRLEALLVIKDFMCLEWSEFKYYRDFHNDIPALNLKFLVDFFSNDYRPFNDYRVYDKDLLIRSMSYYDAIFVYNDIENKMLYVGIAEWEIDEDIKAPTLEEFPFYLNEINSCKISHDNFIELTKKILKLKDHPAPFSVIYRDNIDWISCKGFSSQEELN